MTATRPLAELQNIAKKIRRDIITSTTQGVMPVSEIDGRIIGNSRRGEITTELQLLFDELEAGELR